MDFWVTEQSYNLKEETRSWVFKIILIMVSFFLCNYQLKKINGGRGEEEGEDCTTLFSKGKVK